MELKYIVTETNGPDSFDPVNADKTQNLSVMRMLFATPIEVDKNNSLQSKILKSFTYDRNSDKIIFEVRGDQKFADGSPLTADDVALSIARMAYFRPQFPVLKDIEGVVGWAGSKNGLTAFPQGIKVEGSLITITLVKKNANPLFRFCLELFSVIPATCINRETAQMLCNIPPSSGYFSLKSKSAEEIVFEKRLEQNSIEAVPFDVIKFKFKTLSEACKQKLEANEVISGVELDYFASNCSKDLSAEQVHWMPSSRFGILRFNPHVAPFDKQKNRQIFAETTRQILIKKNSNLLVERGLFSKLLPGFLSNEKLEIPVDQETAESFKGIGITLPRVGHSGLKIIFDSIVEAARFLQMDVQMTSELSNEVMLADFLAGKIGVVAGASGFWAQDPIGDVSMWFTPNLHKTMSFLWSDKQIYKMLSELESEIDPIEIQKKMENLNRYITEQSVLAPVVHFRRLFISSSRITTLNLSQAVTSPTPWQLVPIE